MGAHGRPWRHGKSSHHRSSPSFFFVVSITTRKTNLRVELFIFDSLNFRVINNLMLNLTSKKLYLSHFYPFIYFYNNYLRCTHVNGVCSDCNRCENRSVTECWGTTCHPQATLWIFTKRITSCERISCSAILDIWIQRSVCSHDFHIVAAGSFWSNDHDLL